MSSVEIDGLLFEGMPGSPPSGLVYTRLQGWQSGPPMRDDAEDRADSDGAFSVERSLRSARVLRFQGALVASTQAEAEQLWARWAAIQSDGRPFPLTVTDSLGQRTCMVSLAGEPEVIPINNRRARVVARFIAHDPVKYGQPRSVSTGLPVPGGGLEYPLGSPSGALDYGSNGDLGRVTVSNIGTAPISPRIRVTGGLALGFEVVRLDTSQRLRYDRIVPEGTDVLIDCRTGGVLIDGTSDGSTYLTVADFFQAGRGESFEVQFLALGESTGAPTMTVEWSDGWW